jgi:hypothetical protein
LLLLLLADWPEPEDPAATSGRFTVIEPRQCGQRAELPTSSSRTLRLLSQCGQDIVKNIKIFSKIMADWRIFVRQTNVSGKITPTMAPQRMNTNPSASAYRDL